MTREELIKKVAMKMDEISSSDDVIVPVMAEDNNPQYALINGLLNESINDVLAKVPIHRIQVQIETVQTDTTETLKDGNGATIRQMPVFSVPMDFLRLVSISDPSFMRPIVELATEGDSIAKRQHNRFLMAKTAKPVAVIGRSGNTREIVCYSLGADKTPNTTMTYVKRFTGDESPSATVDLDPYLEEVVAWVCAGKVFSAQGNVAKMQICDTTAAAALTV
jgi:hypothetical protein